MSTAALITQLSSLTHDPVGLSSNLRWLYVSCHCFHLLFSPGQGAATQKAQSVIKTKGHPGPAGAIEPQLKLCLAGRPHHCCPLPTVTICAPTELHSEGDRP